MLNTFDIKIENLNNINHTAGPYCVLCDANSIQDKVVPLLASKFLFDHELRLFQQRKSLSSKKEYLASRFLIKTLISKNFFFKYKKIQLSFNSRELKLQAIVNNKPIAVNISLSHSKGMIFFAISDEKIALGVDIEYQNLKRNIISVSKAFFHPDESKALTTYEHPKFYQLWSLKESLAKAKKQSILELLAQDTMGLLKKFQYCLGQYNNFQLAAVHSSEFGPTPCYLLDLETLLYNYHE